MHTVFVLTLAALLSTPAHAAESVAELYQASYDLEAAQNHAGALARMDRLVELGQVDYVVHLRRGWLLYLVGRYADAVDAYRAAVTAAPESVEARTGLALPLMALRRWAEAEQACAEVLSRAPGNYLAMSRRAYALYSAGRYAEAADQYQAVVTQYPSDVEMRTGLGWALLKQGKASAARKAFEQVLRTAPSHVSAAQGLTASG